MKCLKILCFQISNNERSETVVCTNWMRSDNLQSFENVILWVLFYFGRKVDYSIVGARLYLIRGYLEISKQMYLGIT